MSNLWLLTSTQERKHNISLMIRNIYPTFNGIVAVVNFPSNDGTYELLEESKKEGKIIKRNWVNHHAYVQNELFYCQHIQDGDFCLFLDSPEEPTVEFIDLIPKLIDEFNQKGIDSLYWDNRPYLFKYNEYCQFFNAVHWGISELKNPITLPNKDKYIINHRKEKPEISWCLSPIKYFLCYPHGNEVEIMYGKFGPQEVQKQELYRRQIRKYFQDKRISLNNLDGVIEFFKKIENRQIIPDQFIIDALDFQYRLSELYQLKVLNRDFMNEIVPKRWRWKFSDYYLKDNGFLDENFKQLN